ncbi:MAG: cob(I)yrinic acid a,c-diamide adenosyltransferase, partial [Spirochaetales bacterium]|nr:cob(I)yrinic acid a,c-diamide adenosyltransferase [Spirochaetales bacterium]
MLFVITGNGKGKTTSSLGMVSRALGQGLRCAVIQFLKSNPRALGEYRTFTKLGVPWESWGQGFLWDQKTLEPTAELCRQGWESFKTKASGGDFDLIVLDEFTYVLSFGLLDKKEV